MKGSQYVWGTAVFVSVGAILTGYYDGSTSGVLEMDGFRASFNIYGNSSQHGRCTSQEVDNDDSSANNWSMDLLTNGSDDNEDVSCTSGQSTDSDLIVGVIVSTTCLGSAVGSLIAGWSADHFSRKYTLLMGGAVFTVGSGLLSTAFHVSFFIAGRAVCGIGVGIFFMVMSVYIAEVSPAAWRGALSSLLGPGYAGGFLLGHLLNVGLSRVCIGWRLATSMQALAGLGFTLGVWWIPHTPRYLVMVKRQHEALNVLHKINMSSEEGKFVDTCLELEDLKAACLQQGESSKWYSRYLELGQLKYITRLTLMLVVFFLSAFMGTFIFYFIPSLFCRIGVAPFISSLSVGFIMVLASIVLVFTIEKVGRKTSLVCGAGVNIVLAAVVGVLSHLFGDGNQVAAYFIVVLVSIYTFAFSSSWLMVPFVLASEVFPIRVRGLTMALSTFFYWIFIFLFSQVTPLIIGSPMEIKGFFYLLTAANLLGVVFALLTLPETKGVNLEDMDKLFSRQCFLKVPSRKSKASEPHDPERKHSETELKQDF